MRVRHWWADRLGMTKYYVLTYKVYLYNSDTHYNMYLFICLIYIVNVYIYIYAIYTAEVLVYVNVL